jgi:Transposase DDE domain group 1
LPTSPAWPPERGWGPVPQPGGQARASWRRARRGVAKAEHLPKGPNPRFVVSSLPASALDARTLYEAVYCARGDVENRIKEPGSRPGWGAGPQPRSGREPELFADRTSAATMRANQLRLWFASFAYVLLDALRRIGLRHTQFAVATCGTIRLKLLKIGAQVRKSVRRIKVAMASACPYQAEDHLAHLYLKRAAF